MQHVEPTLMLSATRLNWFVGFGYRWGEIACGCHTDLTQDLVHALARNAKRTRHVRWARRVVLLKHLDDALFGRAHVANIDEKQTLST